MDLIDTTAQTTDDVTRFTRSKLERIIVFSLYLFIVVTGIFGNSLVIYSIHTDPAVQIETQLANMPILNVAYFDLMTTSVVCIPACVFIWFEEYNGGKILCFFWAILNLFGFTGTVAVLAVVSVDRFIAVRWSLHYPQYINYNRLLAACLIQTGSCFSMLWFWIPSKIEYDVAGICEFLWQSNGPENPYIFYLGIFCSFTYFLIPSGVILAANLLILKHSKTKIHVKSVETEQSKQDSKTNSKVLIAMVIVISSFFILTFPSGVLKITKVLTGRRFLKYMPSWLTTSATLLQLSASCVNPLIYGLFRRDFRESYARIWKRLKER